MSDIYDEPGGRWWREEQNLRRITDDLVVVAIRWYEHGLTASVAREAGVVYGDTDYSIIDLHAKLGENEAYDPDLDIVIYVHPDKDSLQSFPDSRYNYLRYVNDQEVVFRIVTSPLVLEDLALAGIPITLRSSLGESEGVDIDEQFRQYHIKEKEYNSNLASKGVSNTGEQDVNVVTNEDWRNFSADPEGYGKPNPKA